MLVVGIILLVLGLLVGAFVIIGGLPDGQSTQVTLSVPGVGDFSTSVVAVFAFGALTLLLLQLGVLAMRSGARRNAKRRSELQRLRRVEAEVQSRQAAEAQRQPAQGGPPSTPGSPAPFARREPVAPPSEPHDVRSDRPPADGAGETRYGSGGSGRAEPDRSTTPSPTPSPVSPSPTPAPVDPDTTDRDPRRDAR